MHFIYLFILKALGIKGLKRGPITVLLSRTARQLQWLQKQAFSQMHRDQGWSSETLAVVSSGGISKQSAFISSFKHSNPKIRKFQ